MVGEGKEKIKKTLKKQLVAHVDVLLGKPLFDTRDPYRRPCFA